MVFALPKQTIQALVGADKLGWHPHPFIAAVSIDPFVMNVARLNTGGRATEGAIVDHLPQGREQSRPLGQGPRREALLLDPEALRALATTRRRSRTSTGWRRPTRSSTCSSVPAGTRPAAARAEGGDDPAARRTTRSCSPGSSLKTAPTDRVRDRAGAAVPLHARGPGRSSGRSCPRAPYGYDVRPRSIPSRKGCRSMKRITPMARVGTRRTPSPRSRSRARRSPRTRPKLDRARRTGDRGTTIRGLPQPDDPTAQRILFFVPDRASRPTSATAGPTIGRPTRRRPPPRSAGDAPADAAPSRRAPRSGTFTCRAAPASSLLRGDQACTGTATHAALLGAQRSRRPADARGAAASSTRFRAPRRGLVLR